MPANIDPDLNYGSDKMISAYGVIYGIPAWLYADKPGSCNFILLDS